jgi:hypothetical protein
MKEFFNIHFNRFTVQFGDDPNSNLNQVLSMLVQNFTANKIEFKYGIVDKKLEPFTQLTKLIRVKKINVYVHVEDEDKDVVGTFKLEDVNFVKIVNFGNVLNGFTNETHIKASYESSLLRVDIDPENIYFEDLHLFKKEYKRSIEAGEGLDSSAKRSKSYITGADIATDAIGTVAVANWDRPMRATYIEDAAAPVGAEQVFDGRIRLGGAL